MDDPEVILNLVVPPATIFRYLRKPSGRCINPPLAERGHINHAKHNCILHSAWRTISIQRRLPMCYKARISLSTTKTTLTMRNYLTTFTADPTSPATRRQVIRQRLTARHPSYRTGALRPRGPRGVWSAGATRATCLRYGALRVDTRVYTNSRPAGHASPVTTGRLFGRRAGKFGRSAGSNRRPPAGAPGATLHDDTGPGRVRRVLR